MCSLTLDPPPPVLDVQAPNAVCCTTPDSSLRSAPLARNWCGLPPDISVPGGYDVYLLDWGIPGPEDKNLSFENYVLDYLPEAVERVLESSSAEEYTLLGHCMGGTISAMYASLFPENLKNLVLLASPTDFAPGNPGLLGLWTLFSRNSEGFFDPDLLVETFGNIPEDLLKRLLSAGTSTAKPLADQYAAWFCATLHSFLPEVAVESWLAVSKWVDDGTPFPGEAFRQWVRAFYQKNKLVKGEIKLRGQRVDLSNIDMPLLNIAGAKDIICPLSQTEATMDLVRSEDKEHLILDAGHVGLMASPEAKETFWPRVENWMRTRSRRWATLNGCKHHLRASEDHPA